MKYLILATLLFSCENKPCKNLKAVKVGMCVKWDNRCSVLMEDGSVKIIHIPVVGGTYCVEHGS